MKSCRTHYKYVINMMNRYLYIILMYVFVYHLYCTHVDIIVSVGMPNLDHDCIMVREG
jgi:hypothetical protein